MCDYRYVKFPPVSTKYCVSGHFRQSIIIITVIVYTTFTESVIITRRYSFVIDANFSCSVDVFTSFASLIAY